MIRSFPYESSFLILDHSKRQVGERAVGRILRYRTDVACQKLIGKAGARLHHSRAEFGRPLNLPFARDCRNHEIARDVIVKSEESRPINRLHDARSFVGRVALYGAGACGSIFHKYKVRVSKNSDEPSPFGFTYSTFVGFQSSMSKSWATTREPGVKRCNLGRI